MKKILISIAVVLIAGSIPAFAKKTHTYTFTTSCDNTYTIKSKKKLTDEEYLELQDWFEASCNFVNTL